ncbi:MAG: Zn-ribbon domain-containing OB-fold protein [Acetobacteraceae bacterium]|nr:Zn-ribbon domain-containing OB-fold protein [Acetobacteraceae bacterium]MSP30522.1 Zn-ribbon domain-containing OB-fold protein [Acetobacteraceae bacterium]
MPESTTKPLPEITADNKPYWDALSEGRLMLQRCAQCGKIRHYPRPVCDGCWSMKVEWVQASGLATVHSWTVTHHPFHQGFKTELPFTLVTVDLEEGVRLNAQTRGLDPAQLGIGQPVRIGFERVTDAITLPVIVSPV